MIVASLLWPIQVQLGVGEPSGKVISYLLAPLLFQFHGIQWLFRQAFAATLAAWPLFGRLTVRLFSAHFILSQRATERARDPANTHTLYSTVCLATERNY